MHAAHTFTRYTAPPGPAAELPRVPPKTTFGGPDSREGRRITAYMAEIEPMLAPWRAGGGGPLGLSLAVGLPHGTDLLTHHDLDNFLEPLASALRSPRLAFAQAVKSHADVSTLRLGPVERDRGELSGWECAVGRCDGVSAAGRRALGRAIAAFATPAPWGPVELDVALRIGAVRNWVTAWKPIIDSLVAILGRRPGASEFDIEDGRIVALRLHREVDARLGHAVETCVRWRQLSTVAGGPVLAYDVLDTQPPPSRTAHDAPSPAPRRSHRLDAGFEAVETLERLRELRHANAGYIVITDTANRPRLHRADCTAIEERFFTTKVIEHHGRNGAYLWTADADDVRTRWPRLSEHGCV